LNFCVQELFIKQRAQLLSVFYIQDFDTKTKSFCRELQDRPYKIYSYVEFGNCKLLCWIWKL